MQKRNIHDAKSHLSELVELAYAGEEVIICKAGRPMVKLVKYKEKKSVRKPGIWRGKVRMAKDFNDSPEIERLFDGEEF